MFVLRKRRQVENYGSSDQCNSSDSRIGSPPLDHSEGTCPQQSNRDSRAPQGGQLPKGRRMDGQGLCLSNSAPKLSDDEVCSWWAPWRDAQRWGGGVTELSSYCMRTGTGKKEVPASQPCADDSNKQKKHVKKRHHWGTWVAPSG